MSVLKKLAGQTAIYGLSSIVGRLLNYLLVPIYLSVFASTSDYGVVAELYAYIAFLVVFLTFGFETAYFRFLNKHKDKETVFNNSFLTILTLNIGFIGLALLLSPTLASTMLIEHVGFIVLLLIIVGIDAVSAIPLAKLRAQENAKRFAIIQFSSIGVNIILNLVLLYGFFDPAEPEIGVYFILIANLCSALVKPLFLFKDFLNIKLKYDKVLGKQMILYALPLVVAGFAFIVNETIDRILLKQIVYGETKDLKYATSQVGIYSANYKLAMLVTIFLQAYRYAAEPYFFAQEKSKDKNKTYVKVMNYFVAAMCLCFLGVALNIDIFKYFLTNEDYWVGLHIVPVLLLANVFSGIYINQSIWYKLSNQTRFGAYIAVVGAIGTVVFNLIFIPIWGFEACAWVTLFVYAGQMTASYILGQKHYPIPYNLRKFGLYFITALLIYFFCRAISVESGALQFFIHNGLLILFLCLVWFMEKPKKI